MKCTDCKNSDTVPRPIPPPPPQCYPSCQKDRLIADKLGQYMMRAGIAFGLVWGTISGVFTLWAIADLFKR